MSHTGDSTLLRKVNESAILQLLREEGPLARSEIARQLRLSPPTITRIVADLIDSGLVLERDTANSTGGRRPTLLEFNARASLIIGVYIHQNMIGALVDLNGQIIERQTVPSVPGAEGIQRLIDLIEDLRCHAAALNLPVRGVGVGAPSVVKFPEGIVAWAPTLGWRDLPLRQILEERLAMPVFVENEVNLIALGESWRGSGRGLSSLVCISLGAGIGAGLVLGGQLYRGANNAAGEIGYMIPSERFLGQMYDADTYGCLEGLAGSTGIVQRALARLQANEPSLLAEQLDENPDGLTVDKVLSAARSGDFLACRVVEETADYLSIALVNLTTVIDPQKIVVSGDLAEFGDLFIERIQARMAGLLPVAPEIVLSELKLDAPILGAVAAALRETSDALVIHPIHA